MINRWHSQPLTLGPVVREPVAETSFANDAASEPVR